MTELVLELDKQACESMNDLMRYYHIGCPADLISKSLGVLKIAAHIDKTDGELIARKGTHETKILLR